MLISFFLPLFLTPSLLLAVSILFAIYLTMHIQLTNVTCIGLKMQYDIDLYLICVRLLGNGVS